MDYLMTLLILVQDAYDEAHLFDEFEDVYNDTLDIIKDITVPASEKLAAIQLLEELKAKGETF